VSTLKRKIGATLAGSAFAASALLSGMPAATADVSPQSSDKPEYKFTIEYVECHKTEDKDDHDEIYLSWDGYRVWGPTDAYEGKKYGVGWGELEEDAKFSLWEYDEAPDDEDDHLGDFWIKKDDYDKGWQYAKFDEHGKYTLKYKVEKYEK
jgi:hypothetical protein